MSIEQRIKVIDEFWRSESSLFPQRLSQRNAALFNACLLASAFNFILRLQMLYSCHYSPFYLFRSSSGHFRSVRTRDALSIGTLLSTFAEINRKVESLAKNRWPHFVLLILNFNFPSQHLLCALLENRSSSEFESTQWAKFPRLWDCLGKLEVTI